MTIDQKIENIGLEYVQVTNIDYSDYPDFVDAMIDYAEWKGTGKALTEDELDYINEYHTDIIHEYALEQAVGG